jgi:hypothetical protein
MLSISACQLASMMFSDTPTVPQLEPLLTESISTRTLAGAIFFVQYTNFIVRKLHPAHFRIELADRFAQRLVQGVDRTVARGGGVLFLAVDKQADGGFGPRFRPLVLLDDHAETLEFKQVGPLAGDLADKQVERALGGFKLVAFVFELLEGPDNLRHFVTIGVQVDAQFVGFVVDVALARKVGDQHAALVADRLGAEMCS